MLVIAATLEAKRPSLMNSDTVTVQPGEEKGCSGTRNKSYPKTF